MNDKKKKRIKKEVNALLKVAHGEMTFSEMRKELDKS